MTMAGDEQLRAALGSEPAHYDELALVDAASAPPPEGATVLFASEPFASPGGRHDVDLVQDTLATGRQLVLPAGAVPTLVFVSTGTVDITTDAGDVVSLGANQSAALAGVLTIAASSDGTEVAAAYVGPSVPRLTQAAGTPVPEGRVIDVSGASITATQGPPAATQATPATPADADDDGDGLTNVDELALNTDPHLADTDDDGLSDGDEVLVYGTLPLAPDTDGDGILDSDEIARGTDPLVADNAPPVVSDEGVSGTIDSDGDGLDDALEADLGTDPFNPDTDDDGLTDGDEYTIYATGLLNPDSDGDGVLDGQEVANGTDPNDPNSF